MRPRDRVLLGTVTVAALLLLVWAAGHPAVCAADGPCDQGARFLPAALGAGLVVVLALGTAVLAHRHRRHVTDGVRRSEGIIALGAALIAVVGILFVILTLFSAGFALRI